MADDVVNPLGAPTTNYGWIKPTVGGDDDAWGGLLNTDLDGIDTTVKSVSNAIPLASSTPPAANGTAAVGTGTTWARADHVHPTDTSGWLGDNRVINGDMRIDQRNNGASGTAAGYTIDRWSFGANQASKGTWQQVVVAVSGFLKALRLLSSSAYASLSSDYFLFMQPIEADMISDFQWGTSTAQPVTLSFWVSSSLTGTFSGAIRNTAATRSYPFTFSIPVAATWTQFSITVPGDTTGTWTLSGNGVGLYLNFDLGCGTTFRGPANAWASADYRGVTGSVSVVGTNAATVYFTGVKLEIGSVATPYNRQSLAKSMADCQRYYFAGLTTFFSSYAAASANFGQTFIWPVTMRAAPTVSLAGATGANQSGATAYQVTTVGAATYATATALGTAALNVPNLTATAEL